MNRKSISKFFTTFLIVYIVVIFSGILLAKTGTANYKTHVTRYWEDEKHFASVFGKEGQSSLLAGSDGKVQALTWPQIVWAVQAVRFFEGKGNNQGFVQNSLTSTFDTLGDPLIGGTISDCQQTFAAASSSGQLTGNADCNVDNMIFNHVIPDNINITAQSGGSNGGLMGFTTDLTRRIFKEQDNITSMSLYAQSLSKEVPFVWSQIAEAAWWGAPLQGFTFGTGFFQLWEASRNITYYLIIIPAVALGFAVMFRMQINPQTQITLMRIIPRLLIVILLITFSYPIAALMGQLAEPIADIGIGLLSFFSSSLTAGTFSWATLNMLILSAVFGTLTFLTGGLFALILGIILLIIAILALIRYLFTAFVIMVKAGFLIGFGPLILVVAAFPGREGIIKQYFVNLGSNFLALSAISIMFAASYSIIYIGINNDNFLVMLTLLFVGLGIFWKAPSAPKMVAQMLGAQPMFESMGFGGAGGAGGKPDARKR